MEDKGLRILLVLGLLVLTCLGCKRETRYPGQRIERAVPTTPSWGPEAEGLQCRIRPAKRLWNPGETLLFKVDLRNGGKRVFAVSEPVRAERVILDGRWRALVQSAGLQVKVHRLGPGAELADLVLSLPPATQLPLGPGRHQVQVALVFEGIEVTSGPVGIEIAATPQTDLGRTRTVFPGIGYSVAVVWPADFRQRHH